MKSQPDFKECEACTCFAVRRAARAITQLYERHLRGSGLRANQFTLLVVLARAGKSVPMSRLATLLGVERTTLTRNLQLLEAKRFVVVNSTDDRRVRGVAITERGRAALGDALPAWRKAQAAVAKHVDRSAVAALSSAVAARA